MSEKLLTDLLNTGFLSVKKADETEVLHLTTPCRFRFTREIVKDLKTNYVSYEEIGGVFWAKPTLENDEKVYVVDKVSYVRNVIEENSSDRKKSNTYLPDRKQMQEELQAILKEEYLPIKFHTHPVKGSDFFQSLNFQNLKTETSKQDKSESYWPHIIGSRNLFMPRALIVGNDMSGNDIFIGLYNGLIAPTEFKESKKKVQKENLEKSTETISSIELKDWERAGLIIGGIFIFILLIRYIKYSWPVLIGLAAVFETWSTKTQNLDSSNFFSKLSYGNADIFIPKAEE